MNSIEINFIFKAKIIRYKYVISRQNKLVSIDIKDMSQFLFFEILQKKNTVTTDRVYGIIIIKRKKENKAKLNLLATERFYL